MKISLCFALILLTFSLRASEPTPLWADLEGLFGQSVQGDTMQKFVKSHGLEEVTKGDSGNFTPRDQSYSINFEKTHVNCIVLHVEIAPQTYGDTKLTGYSTDLPFGLKRIYARKDVIELLGEPDISAGNFWQVRDCELRISFSKSTGLIQEVYVWKKNKSPQKKAA